jgi:uncharacterized iron-regulated membrane protein
MALLQENKTQNKQVTGASWWRSPQRLWLRRAIFQAHLWFGLVLAVYSVVIGLSGAALVFKEQIEKTAEPEIYRASAGQQQVSLQQAIQRIEADRPGWRVTGMKDFDQHTIAVTALMGRKGAPPNANYRAVLFDPNTGRVVRDRMRFDGTLGWLSNLHFYLLSGKTGLLISGWMAVGLLVLSLTGIVLWWPGVKRSIGAMMLRIHHSPHRNGTNWKRFNWDAHSVIGFWSCAALIVVTFTGLYFCFPKAIGNVTVLATGGSLKVAEQQAEAPDRKPSSSSLPIMTVDQAVDAARRALPSGAPAGYLSVPYRPGAAYSVTGYYRDSLPYSELVRVSLDPRTGEVLGYSDTTKQMRGLRVIQYFFAVHFGSFGGHGWLGVLVRCLWVLLGIAPAVLAVTGVVMYWNRKLRPLAKRLMA